MPEEGYGKVGVGQRIGLVSSVLGPEGKRAVGEGDQLSLQPGGEGGAAEGEVLRGKPPAGGVQSPVLIPILLGELHVAGIGGVENRALCLRQNHHHGGVTGLRVVAPLLIENVPVRRMHAQEPAARFIPVFDIEVPAVGPLRHLVQPGPVLGQLKGEAPDLAGVGGVDFRPNHGQKVHRDDLLAVLRVWQGGVQGELGDGGEVPRRQQVLVLGADGGNLGVGEGDGVGLARLPDSAVQVVEAHAALAVHLLPRRNVDGPVRGGGVACRDGEGEGGGVGVKGDALLQCIQRLPGGEGVPGRGFPALRLLAGHQAAQGQHQGQGAAQQGHAPALFQEQVAQPVLQLSLSAAEAGGKGGTGGIRGGLEQHLAVLTPPAAVQAADDRLVTAQLQVAARLPGHPPHQGIEPVDRVGQQHDRLVGHIPALQVEQLVAEGQIQLAVRQAPVWEENHRPGQPQHHGGADGGGAHQSHGAADVQRLPEGGAPVRLFRGGGQGGAKQPPPGQQVGHAVERQEDCRARQPENGEQLGGADGHRLRLRGGLNLLGQGFRRGLTGLAGGILLGWDHVLHRGGALYRRGDGISGHLHRDGGGEPAQLYRQDQPQGQQEKEHVEGTGGVTVADAPGQEQQGQQHSGAGRRQCEHA